jgi:DNA-binding CsgD family transcriptional regulator
LHPRSEQVYALAARGLSQTAIAAQLGIARATVQRHLKKRVLTEKTVSA